MNPTKPCSTSRIETPPKLIEPPPLPPTKSYVEALPTPTTRGLGLCQTLNPKTYWKGTPPWWILQARAGAAEPVLSGEGVADVNLLLGC